MIDFSETVLELERWQGHIESKGINRDELLARGCGASYHHLSDEKRLPATESALQALFTEACSAGVLCLPDGVSGDDISVSLQEGGHAEGSSDNEMWDRKYTHSFFGPELCLRAVFLPTGCSTIGAEGKILHA